MNGNLEMNDDLELVRRYALHQSEEAFETLISRHVGLVYSAAVRRVHDTHLAEEITQTVFIVLARKAGSLGPKTILSGWLYRTTHYVASAAVRMRQRRERREEKAQMQVTQSETDSTWEQLAPILEEAMAQLREKDRDAIVLRYFQNKSLREVGLAFGVNEYAAQKRVARGLEKLRAFFASHGVQSTTAIISGAISRNSIQTAPAVWVKTISAVALTKGAAASASTLTLAKGALNLMAWTKVQTAIAIGVGALLVAGTVGIAVKHAAASGHAVWFGHEAWREKWDTSYLRRLPAQVEILPAIASRRDNGIAHSGSDGIMGLGNSIALIVEDAYGVNVGRTIFSVPVPQGSYDFFSNIPRNVAPALQEELKKKFGLAAWIELVQTNVLVLTVQDPHAPGLKPSRPSENLGGNEEWNTHSIDGANEPISYLDGIIEDYLKVPVVDQTGLTGRYDIHLKGNSTDEGFKRAVREQLGLQLISADMPIEMLVVGTNPPPVPAPLTDAEFSPRPGSDLQGFWAGTAARGRAAVRVQMKIAEAWDGTFRADVYCPGASGTNRIPAQVSYDGTTVKAIPMLPILGLGMFEGRLRDGGNEIAGDWIQNGTPISTTLRRADYSKYRAQR